MKDNILIIGGDGMLGSTLYMYLKNKGYNVFGTSRNTTSNLLFYIIDQDNIPKLKNIIKERNINIIINCAVINKINKDNMLDAIIVNSLFPNYIARYIACKDIKFIHISTNGFYPINGNNKETTEPYFNNLYGISKYLGERDNKYTLCLRTSIIGYSNKPCKEKSLLDWFLSLSENEVISGYSKVLRNGLTTLTLAKIIDYLLYNKQIHGIHNVSGEMASKYELLKLINSIFNRKVLIQKDENMICDQTIIMSDQLKELAHIIKPIKDQIEDMKRRKENISQY